MEEEEESGSTSASPLMYDVFLSFRGEDTRHGFLSHLHAALWRKKIKMFIDYQLRKGDDISPSLLTAIERSMISVVVFSKDYASSKWCLDELVKILECRKNDGQIVIPVFYGIDPSHVRKQTGPFGEAFAKHEKVFGENSEKVKRWRAALTAAANLVGWDSGVVRIEYVLVNKIAMDVLRKMEYKRLIEKDGLVGVESKVNSIESFLCTGSNDVRALGISGIGGIGKSALAGAVFNRISYLFEGCYFAANVREESEVRGGLVLLRQRLLSTIFGDEYADIGTFGRGRNCPMKMLRRKKVLIVLDDVTNYHQFEYLTTGFENLGVGSRILVTSRDTQVLRNCGVDRIYELKELFLDEALKLFSWCAFGQNHPTVEYMELSNKVVAFAGGVPLALKVLGSTLFGKAKHMWKSVIHKMERALHPKVLTVLKISYYALPDDIQTMFLNIACFFVGENIVHVKRFIDSRGFSAEIGLSFLIDKSLITVSNNTIEMHGLIQLMGRDIVRQESIKECGKRSRLWDHEDIYHVLRSNTGTESVEGISLDMSKIRDIYLNPHAFKKMPNLKFLKFYSSSNEKNSKVHALQGLESSFTELRYFHWHAYPMESLPSSFCPENLFALHLPFSNMKQLWNVGQHFDKLKSIDLSHSRLTKIPNLALAPSLESLILEGCTRLFEIPSSIKCLNKLVRLNLRDCTSLESLPNCLQLNSLRILILSGCSSLSKMPEISGNVQELYLGETRMEELPSSIIHLSSLVVLDLENCSMLNSLPDGICNLTSLEDLNLCGCSKLQSLPEDLENLKALKKLKVSGAGIRELPSSIVRLINLGTLSIVRCQGEEPMGLQLPPLVGLNNVSNLVLSDCNIKELPECLGRLSSLKRLNLCRNNFVSIPESIMHLSKLILLDVSYCKWLKSIPILPRDLKLVARNCTSLEAFSGVSVPFARRSLHTLAVDFINCFKLQQNAVRNLVDYALQKIQLLPTALSTELDEESDDEIPSVFIWYPGNEIPEWFTFQNTESFVVVRHLPQGWFSDNLVGFALCAVVEFQYPYDDGRGLVLVCECEFKSQDGSCHVAKGYFIGWGIDKHGTHYVGSDHVFLGCDFVLYPENFGENYYSNEFSVQFYIEDYYSERMNSCEVKKCGVRLIYRHEFGKPILSTSSDEDYFCKCMEETIGSFCADMEEEVLHG